MTGAAFRFLIHLLDWAAYQVNNDRSTLHREAQERLAAQRAELRK